MKPDTIVCIDRKWPGYPVLEDAVDYVQLGAFAGEMVKADASSPYLQLRMSLTKTQEVVTVMIPHSSVECVVTGLADWEGVFDKFMRTP
ncbi:MAG TPA: hypothetical protein VG796_11335 [Verrucomicrobiales bacterium]|nr:hypothetical protein [Verrucomicrobiales bacterium]